MRSAASSKLARPLWRGQILVQVAQPRGEITLEVGAGDWLARLHARCATKPGSASSTFIDLCGVDYLGYGDDEWDTDGRLREGFSRGVEGKGPGRFKWGEQPSHQVAAGHRAGFAGTIAMPWSHLLSMRTTAACACAASPPTMPAGGASVTGVWAGANWFEREAFDLFGILFEGPSGPAPDPHRLRLRRASRSARTSR
jgi:NADH-quinone oxidoreductase subunit C